MSDRNDTDLIQRIRTDLQRLSVRDVESAAPMMERGRRRRRVAFIRSGLLAVLLAIAVVGPLILLSGLYGHRRGPVPATPPPATTQPSPGTVLSDTALDGSSQGFAAIDGTAWAATIHEFVRIATGSPMVTLSMRQAPEVLVTGPAGDVWLGGFEPGAGAYLARIAGSEGSPDLLVPLPPETGVSAITASTNAVWAQVQPTNALGLGTLYRLDPSSGAVVDRISLSDVKAANPQDHPYVYDMSADASSIYLTVADIGNGQGSNYRVVRISATSGKVTATFPTPGGYVVAAYGSVWTDSATGPIRLDTDLSNPRSLNLPADMYPFGYGSNSVWFIETLNSITRIVGLGAASGQPEIDVSVPRKTIWGSVEATYDGAGHVWLFYENGRVQEIAV